MSWQPRASLNAIEVRAELYEKIRTFFLIRNVLEVETPLLNSYAVTDQQIESIATEHSQYLHTSPEYAMKRMLAFYQRDIYQVCKVFRASEKGAYHHSEFTMLEWYRISWSYKDLMQEVAELVKTLLCNSDDSLNTQQISYQQAFKKYLNIDVRTATQADYLQVCADHSVKLSTVLTVQQYQEFILDQIIVPKMQQNCLIFIYDYPIEQAALAQINSEACAERFELYLNGIELANGFQELTDAKEQELRFEEDNRKRLQDNKNAIDIDKNFIAALDSGLPECAGVAIGIDRLLMIILGVKHIEEVISFRVS